MPQCMCQVSLRLKEVQMWTHNFKYYNVPPFFARNPGNIKTSMSAATILALVPASRYYCDVTWSVIPQCMCQVSIRLKEVQLGTHDFKYNKLPIFARKPGNINTSMSAAPKLALVPAGRYYCNVT